MQIKRAWRVLQRHWTVYTKLYKSSFALNFIEPVLYLVAMGMGLGVFVQDINGQPYIKFIGPGIIASSSMFAAVYECTYGTYIRMTFQKTFDAILATPVAIAPPARAVTPATPHPPRERSEPLEDRAGWRAACARRRRNTGALEEQKRVHDA